MTPEEHARDLILRMAAMRPQGADDLPKLLIFSFKRAIDEERARCVQTAGQRFEWLRWGLEEIVRGTEPKAGSGDPWPSRIASEALREAGIPDGAAGIQKPAPMKADPQHIVLIDYTNHLGLRSMRRIQPLRLVFESNKWHPETQWILEAIDLKKNKERSFAVAMIHSWRPCE